MTDSPKKQTAIWKLSLAMGFLGFSLWLSVGPLLTEKLSSLAEGEVPMVEELHRYGGFKSPTNLLSRYGSYTGEARQIPDPFTWIGLEPHPAPGGAASIQLIQELSESAEVLETRIQQDEEEPIPELQVRLILKTERSSRVLVDGQILGVGDLTRAGKIVEILDRGIQTMYRGKKLFFALSPR